MWGPIIPGKLLVCLEIRSFEYPAMDEVLVHQPRHREKDPYFPAGEYIVMFGYKSVSANVATIKSIIAKKLYRLLLQVTVCRRRSMIGFPHSSVIIFSSHAGVAGCEIKVSISSLVPLISSVHAL